MKNQILILFSVLSLPIISSANQENLIEMTRQSVLSELKDPESAQFKKIELVTNSLNEYVKDFEAILKKYPNQWFNLYNFWER